MSGHFELGEIIKNHKDSDVGKLYMIIFLAMSLEVHLELIFYTYVLGLEAFQAALKHLHFF